MLGLGDWIRYNADWSGKRVALDLDGEFFTYAEMDAAVDRRAHLLTALGVQRGGRVAYLGFNHPELLLLLYACARAGASLLPLNNRLAVPELEWILAHSEVSHLFVEDEFTAAAAELETALPGLTPVALGEAPRWRRLAEGLADVPETRFEDVGGPDDPCLLIYTSGTTGRPKGVVHTQRALFYNALNAIHAQEMRASDHVLAVLPLFHSGGLNIQTTPAFYVGARVSLLRRFDPGATLAAIRNLRPSLLLAVPAVIRALADHPDWPHTDIGCLRMVGTGSSTVPHALLRTFMDRGVPATQIYGLTESAPTAVCLPIHEAYRKMGAAGKPCIHCQVRVVSETGAPCSANVRGEIVLRGPNLFSEYLDEPQMTTEAFSDGWFHTGDIGHFDDEGFLYVDDRKKDVIISGGENLYPAELENVLAEIPELAEFAVVARPHPRWGEAAVACVVVRDGAEIDAAGVLAHFDGRLARFKRPREVVFMPTLPRNAMGKVLKYQLREQLAQD